MASGVLLIFLNIPVTHHFQSFFKLLDKAPEPAAYCEKLSFKRYGKTEVATSIPLPKNCPNTNFRPRRIFPFPYGDLSVIGCQSEYLVQI